MSEPRDRKMLCDAYCEQNPADEFDYDIHVIIGDYNFEDYWLFGGIAKLATKLRDDDENQDLRRRLLFLVELLNAPMPEGWEDDEAI